MKQITIEMPVVSECKVSQCAYNMAQKCHAKAITVGDTQNPGCDTFFQSQPRGHSRDNTRIAGVGACKVSSCKYNKDFECSADTIRVGFSGQKVNCLTYATS